MTDSCDGDSGKLVCYLEGDAYDSADFKLLTEDDIQELEDKGIEIARPPQEASGFPGTSAPSAALPDEGAPSCPTWCATPR